MRCSCVARVPTNAASVIRNKNLAAQLLRTLGSKSACIMRGHGITTVGRTAQEAALRALRPEELAALCWELSLRGTVPKSTRQIGTNFDRWPTRVGHRGRLKRNVDLALLCAPAGRPRAWSRRGLKSHAHCQVEPVLTHNVPQPNVPH